jgi:outer membrane immunogenic protein
VKKLLSATVAVVLISASASAADLAPPSTVTPVLPPVVALPTWTGVYLGGHVGGGWGDKWFTGGFGESDGTVPLQGFLGGGQIGANWQIDRWVLGLEGTFTGTDLTGTGIAFADFGHEFNAKVNWLATVIGRVGVTIDHALLYAGGGVAFVRETDTFTDHNEFQRPASNWTGHNTNTGFTFLAGVEYAIDQYWSARIQYNYYQVGESFINLLPDSTGSGPLPENTKLRMQSISAGVNYRFNWL